MTVTATATPTGEAPRRGTAGVLAMAALALAAEFAWLVLATDRAAAFAAPVAPGWAVAGHLATVGLLALWVWWRHRRDLDLRLPGLLVVTTPFLGPLGPLFTIATVGLHAAFSRYAMGFQDWYLSLFPESEVQPARELYELIASGREQAHLTASASFTDVMTVGSPAQKQAVIALVARYFRPAFTPALKQGLADGDPSVRVQAATATARVEHEFNERWQRLLRAAQSHPMDVRCQRELALHLDDYAFCGLLDANRELEVREKALEGYRRCLDLAPGDATLRLDLGRLLLRLGLVEEAASVLEPLAEDTTDRRLLVWYAESLFRLHRYAELRDLCRRRADLLGEATGLSDTLRDVMGLWNGAGEPREEAA